MLPWLPAWWHTHDILSTFLVPKWSLTFLEIFRHFSCWGELHCFGVKINPWKNTCKIRLTGLPFTIPTFPTPSLREATIKNNLYLVLKDLEAVFLPSLQFPAQVAFWDFQITLWGLRSHWLNSRMFSCHKSWFNNFSNVSLMPVSY